MNKYASLAAFTALGLLIGALTTAYVCQSYYIDLEKAGEGLVSLFSAFFGAWAAFSLQASREKRREKEAEHQSMLQIQFQLIGQYRKLSQTHSQAIEPYKNSGSAWLEMRPGQQLVVEDLRANLVSLHFLLKQHPNEILELRVAQESFFTAIQAINIRSDLHINHFQPAIEALMKSGVILASVGDFEKNLEPRMLANMKSAASGCIESFEIALHNLLAATTKLYQIAKARHPSEEFIQIG